MHYWWPQIPNWISVLFFFVVITLVNLGNVKFYGESEFWLSIIKVTAIVAMIVFGYLFSSDRRCKFKYCFFKPMAHGGFFPNGFSRLFYMLAFLMFGFGGIELVGMTAAEARRPRKNDT